MAVPSRGAMSGWSVGRDSAHLHLSPDPQQPKPCVLRRMARKRGARYSFNLEKPWGPSPVGLLQEPGPGVRDLDPVPGPGCLQVAALRAHRRGGIGHRTAPWQSQGARGAEGTVAVAGGHPSRLDARRRRVGVCRLQRPSVSVCACSHTASTTSATQPPPPPPPPPLSRACFRAARDDTPWLHHGGVCGGGAGGE